MLYVLDMDGVIWTMDDPVPGAPEAINRLLNRGDKVCYLTNNSSKTRSDYVNKLAKFGIRAIDADIMTSAHAAALSLAEHGAAGKLAYVIGEQGLISELTSVGIAVANEREAADADYVVVGWDRDFTYAKLAAAHTAIMNGAEFIATNRDASYPDAGGKTLPGGGSLVAAVATSTGVTPRTIGKPERYMLDLLLSHTSVDPANCTVIGDRLDTDVDIGRRVGTRTILVLSGISTVQEAEFAAAADRPDLVLNSLADLEA